MTLAVTVKQGQWAAPVCPDHAPWPCSRRVTLALVLLWLAGCSAPDDGAWRGYYYTDVLSNGPALVSGPYADGPQCVAAMRKMLRKAPATASFTCGRGCVSKPDGSASDCREIAR